MYEITNSKGCKMAIGDSRPILAVYTNEEGRNWKGQMLYTLYVSIRESEGTSTYTIASLTKKSLDEHYNNLTTGIPKV